MFNNHFLITHEGDKTFKVKSKSCDAIDFEDHFGEPIISVFMDERPPFAKHIWYIAYLAAVREGVAVGQTFDQWRQDVESVQPLCPHGNESDKCEECPKEEGGLPEASGRSPSPGE